MSDAAGQGPQHGDKTTNDSDGFAVTNGVDIPKRQHIVAQFKSLTDWTAMYLQYVRAGDDVHAKRAFGFVRDEMNAIKKMHGAAYTKPRAKKEKKAKKS